MTIDTIIGEDGVQSELCSGGACPAAILASDGNLYVQGYLPKKQAQDVLHAPEGEGFVAIPLDTALKIAAHVSAL